MNRPVLISVALSAFGLSFASAQPAPSSVWTGTASCAVDVDGGQDYNDQQVHTWSIKSAVTPVREGAFDVHDATWSVTGRGHRAVAGTVFFGVSRATVNRATWIHNVRDVKAPLAAFVRASDRRLSMVARHSQLNAPNGATGQETYSWVNGHPLCKGASDFLCNNALGKGQAQDPRPIAHTVYEFPFPRIEDAVTSTHLTGWTTPLPVANSVFPLQPPTAKGQVTCTWDFKSAPMTPTFQLPPKPRASPAKRGR